MPRSAEASSDWGTRTLDERVGWVRRFRGLLAGAEGSLCRLAEDEVGKPRAETLTAEIIPLLGACRWIERRGRRLLAPRRVRGGGLLGIGQQVVEQRAPLGRVAVIATWNYPIGLLGTQLVQGLAAGNEVLVKPSEHAPRTQHRLMDLMIEAGLPRGALARVEATREAGRAMLAGRRDLGGERALDHVVFTGSTSVGCAIAETLAPRLVPSTLELSGRDSAFVLADADARLAARTIWWAVTANAGQTCMAPKRALVDEAVYERFLIELSQPAAGARPRALISPEAARACFDQAVDAVDAGGRSLSAVLEPPKGRVFRPLAIVDCPSDAELVEGATFGPVLAVIPVRRVEDALAIHHRCDQHLATSVFSRDEERARALAPRLGATTVTINDCVIPTAHPAVSIGGRGMSGWGVSRGRAGLLAMTRPVYVSRTSRWIRVPVGEQSEERVERLAGFVRWLHGARPSRGPRTVVSEDGLHMADHRAEHTGLRQEVQT